MGPVVVGGVTFTLVVPAVAIAAGVEITMTPVSLGGAPFQDYGALRFGPSGTTFRVPATLVAQGLPDVPVASAVLDDNGLGAVLTFVPSQGGVARAPVEHFSLVGIINAGATAGDIAAAGLASVPSDSISAAPALATALDVTVLPAITGAGNSLFALVRAGRILAEWQAAAQGRGLASSPFSALGGRTFGQAGADAATLLVTEGLRVMADLSRPNCVDRTGALNHPYEWFGALAHVVSLVRDIGGNPVMPNGFAPCLALSFPEEVRTQSGTIGSMQRFVQVFVALDATTPTGFTGPMKGSFVLDAGGATGQTGDNPVFFDAASPGLMPVDLDRGLDCDGLRPSAWRWCSPARSMGHLAWSTWT